MSAVPPPAIALSRQRIDAEPLRRLTATMAPAVEDAATLVRAMRDGDHY